MGCGKARGQRVGKCRQQKKGGKKEIALCLNAGFATKNFAAFGAGRGSGG